jgi:hypothetical protein
MLKKVLACDEMILILLSRNPRCSNVVSYKIQVAYTGVSPSSLYMPRTALFYIQKKEFIESNRIYKPSIIK